MTTYKPTPLCGPNGTIAYNADGSKAMTTNKPGVVVLVDSLQAISRSELGSQRVRVGGKIKSYEIGELT